MNAEAMTEKARLRICDQQRGKATARLMACPHFVLDGLGEYAYSSRMDEAIANADHAEIGRLILEAASQRAKEVLDDIERGICHNETPMQLVHEYEQWEEEAQRRIAEASV